MKHLLLFIFICLNSSFSQSAFAKPERIVSLSLCSDELVLALAEPENIASLSYLSADPDFADFDSALPEVYLNQGRAEEIIALSPDMIISSRFSASNAVSLLRQLDYPVNILGFPADLETSYRQIREVAALLEEPARGEQLIRDMQSSLEQIQFALVSQRGSSAVFYANNGFSYGKGTLRDFFLSSLQITNVASEAGLNDVGKLPLELLLEAQPDFILVNTPGSDDERLASPLLSHPVLQHAFSTEQIIVLPDKYFQCAGPSLLKAYSLMLEALGISP
jgi:iron complex transport system substrate-binding protein